MRGVRRPRTGGEWLVAALWVLYAVMWVGGIASYVILGGVRRGDEWTAPAFLGLAGVIVLVAAQRRAPVLLCAGLLGFAAEWIGLYSGMIFGDYRYTEALAPTLFNVPIVMVSAWLVLVAYCDHLSRRVQRGVAAQVVCGAALLTAIDLIIDPVAAGPLQYWTWSQGGAYYGIPAHNFAGWFIAGGLILLMVRRTPAPEESVVILGVGLSIVVFFTIVAAANGLLWPTLVGLSVTAVHALRRRDSPEPAAAGPFGAGGLVM